jgi:hypothetical protein
MQTLLAVIGAGALWLTFVWLGSAIVASLLSHAKGYGEKPGLVTGTVLTVLGAFIWAVWPAQEISRWKIHEGLNGTERVVQAVLLIIIAIVGVFLVVTIDAGTTGRIGLAAVVIMLLVIFAQLMKVLSITRATGGKTMAELRAEREAAAH